MINPSFVIYSGSYHDCDGFPEQVPLWHHDNSSGSVSTCGIISKPVEMEYEGPIYAEQINNKF